MKAHELGKILCSMPSQSDVCVAVDEGHHGIVTRVAQVTVKHEADASGCWVVLEMKPTCGFDTLRGWSKES